VPTSFSNEPLSRFKAQPACGYAPLRAGIASGPGLAGKSTVTNFTFGNPIMLPFVASRVRKLTFTSKSTEVIARFVLRMVAIAAFAALAGIGFQRGLIAMLWMSTILSAVIATFDREEPLEKTLNHWDETAAYAALCCLAFVFQWPVPFG
jgi:hypothetical protein